MTEPMYVEVSFAGGKRSGDASDNAPHAFWLVDLDIYCDSSFRSTWLPQYPNVIPLRMGEEGPLAAASGHPESAAEASRRMSTNNRQISTS